MTPILHYAIPYSNPDLLNFLRFGAGMPRFYFENEQSPHSLAGIGISAQVNAQGNDRFKQLAQHLKTLTKRIIPFSKFQEIPAPMLFCGASFFPTVQASEWRTFPIATLVLPRYSLNQWNGKTFFALNLPLLEGETINEAARRAKIEAEEVLLSLEATLSPGDLPFSEITWQGGDFSAWQNAVNEALRRIEAGDLYKIVLARTLQGVSTHPIDPVPLLERIKKTCTGCFRFLFEFRPNHIFLGTTPERLLQVKDNIVSTLALAGSIRRGLTTDEDEMLASELSTSIKDRHEHAIVVENIRQRLTPLTETLSIAPMPTVLRLPNIQHLHTPIQGQLRPKINALDILAALHPTPAVGGQPLTLALDLIPRFEHFERGWYAGPIGLISLDGTADFAVAIRSALINQKNITLFGGAGIVAGSDARKEWEETALKMRFLQSLIETEMVR